MTDDELVTARARQIYFSAVRYFYDHDMPPSVLSQAARELYLQGEVSVETFERYLDLEFGLPTVR